MTLTTNIKNLCLPAALGLAIISYSPPGASAQQSNLCTSRDALVKALNGRFQESRRGMGLASNTGMMEFYVSSKGTWTVVMNMTNGMSCILAAGRDWEELKIKPAGTNT